MLEQLTNIEEIQNILYPKIRKDISGKKYGKLTAIKLCPVQKDSKIRWECICDCGNTKSINYGRLTSGHTISCGCAKNSQHQYRGGKYVTGEEFSGIRRGAKDRNLDFLITIQDIEEIYERQNKLCNLTGEYIIFNSREINKIRIRGNASVDRINSYKGYTKDNIQILHKDVNIAKQSMTNEEFINMCNKVSKHNRSV